MKKLTKQISEVKKTPIQWAIDLENSDADESSGDVKSVSN